MKTLFTTVAAIAFSAGAFAGSPFDAEDTYGTVLFDQGAAPSGTYTEPSSSVAAEIFSGDTYGSVLFDLENATYQDTVGAQPSIGDEADDYGNVLYDIGSRY